MVNNKWGIHFISSGTVKVYQKIGKAKFTISETMYKELWKKSKKDK